MAEQAKASRASKTAQPDDRPLLDLSTLDKIEFIKIDGKRYDLVNLDAESLQSRNRVTTLFVRCLELIVESARDDEKPLSKMKQRELTRSVNDLLPLIVPSIPPAVLAKLNDLQKQEIVTAFFVVRSEKTAGSTVIQRMAGIAEGLRSSIGEPSSLGSNGSTVVPLNRGMRRSRRRSSARS